MNSVPHLELALFRLTLHNLDRGFLRTVGPRYVELDEARAQSSKLRARFYPAAHRESLAARELARVSALACAAARLAPNPERLKHLHHELARQYHPDLANDPAHRTLCEQLMTEINLAHTDNDPDRLEILHEALTETGDVITQLQQLTRTPLAELHERIDYATRHHHDLLAELANRIQERTLDEKLRTAQTARRLSSSSTPADLIARALGDLAELSTRRLVFPATHSMGQLSIRGEFNIDAAPTVLGAARGSVGVPFGKSVILRLDAACSDLSPLDRLDPDDINGFVDEWPEFVQLNDEALQPLARFTRLEELRIGRTEITGRVFDRFRSLHELRVLVLDETEFDDSGMQHLEASVWMQRLDLSFTRVSGEGLRALHNMTALRELSLYGTSLRDDDISWLERTPDLRNLNLGLTGITNEGARHLSQLRKMEVLHLGGTGVTDTVLDHLADLPKLRELVLWETAITPAGAKRLRNFSALQYLDVDKTAVTPEALAAFHAARPDIKIPSDIWQET